MQTWFTSDEHIGHKNIIKFCNRPFISLEHMRQELVSRHNDRVKDGDDVFHVGDMFWRTFGAENAIEYMRQLNGTHHYVFGNHEELMEQSLGLRSFFVRMYNRIHIFPEGGPKKGIVLDHYAGRVWAGSDKGSWQLYGHSHGDLPEIDPLLSMDVGVDANNWYPVSLDEVKERMAEKVRRITRGLGIGS